ncbi:ATP-binding protein, partial [Candidatus Woesearchaeota archaeon]|nr:ATP-binding protein [Candidatus Woesearchaeota archaeon]
MGGNARLKRSLGSDIVDRISELAISDTYSALIELLANSYDADASRVDLAYDGTMSVSDDGDGMTPKDLESFYRLGDSPKRTETVSPKGRTRIGKYGVATILLKYLTREYTLVTQKGGIESVVHEKFEGRLSPAKEIPFKTKRVDKKLHGTTISLSGLNFDVREDDFELSELINRIQWELPLLPDFTVYVNGEQVKSKSIENAVEFRIDEQRERMGRVHGSFYFCRRPTPMAGIHVYVNGRRVGDPKTFLGNSEKLRAGQQTRVVAVLHADDLEKAILFNRRMFKEDDAGYKKLRQLASKALYKIRNYVESHSVSNRGQYIENRMSVLIDKIRKRLVSGGVREITAETQFKFSTDIKRMFPGKYEQAANIFYFNKDFPSLSVEMYRTAQQYELALLNAVVDTLAYRRAHRKQKKSIDTLVAERHGIWHELGNTRGYETTPDKIHPMRVYTLAELARFSDRSIGALRNLVQSGLLQHIDDKVVGSSFIEVERKT